MFQTIQLDLTKIGRIVREHPEAVLKINFKDGEHTLINGIVKTTDYTDEYHTEDIFFNPKDVKLKSKEDYKHWKGGTTKVFPPKEDTTSAPITPTPVNTAPPADPYSASADSDNLPF